MNDPSERDHGGNTGKAGRSAEQADPEARGQSLLLEVTLNSIDQGIVVWDADDCLVIYNERYRELWNYPGDLLKPGLPAIEVLRYDVLQGEHGDGDPEEIAQRRLATANSRLDDEPELFTTREGVILLIRRYTVPDLGFVSTFTDVTELKEVEIALEERSEDLRIARDNAEAANRSKSDFLANMSHELRTPLNAIIGYSQMIGGEMLGKSNIPKYREYALDITSSGQHLLAVINEILDLSKIEAGEIEVDEAEIDVGDAIESTVKFVRLDSESKGQNLVVNVPADLPRLRVDDRLFRQIVLNLLSNAIKFTPEGGGITVGVKLDERGGMSMSVVDTGVGISAENIHTVLEPFGQVSPSPELARQGTGLGLPLTRKFVELHGGALLIDSEPGKGTTLTASFPPERTRG